MVNIAVFLNLYIKTTTNAVVFVFIGTKSRDFAQLWLLIYLTPKFETSQSKGKTTAFAVALLFHHGTSVTLAPAEGQLWLLIYLTLKLQASESGIQLLNIIFILSNNYI